MVSVKFSTNLYVKRTCFAEIMALNECELECKFFTDIFTFQGNGAVKRFVITTSVNQNLTTNNKFQSANRLGKMTGQLINRYTLTFWKKQKCLCEGDPELSMTRNCRVHCTTNTTNILSLKIPCTG